MCLTTCTKRPENNPETWPISFQRTHTFISRNEVSRHFVIVTIRPQHENSRMSLLWSDVLHSLKSASCLELALICFQSFYPLRPNLSPLPLCLHNFNLTKRPVFDDPASQKKKKMHASHTGVWRRWGPLKEETENLTVFWCNPESTRSIQLQPTSFPTPQEPLSQLSQRRCMTQVRSNSTLEYQFPSVASAVETRTLGTRTGHMIWGWKLIFGTPDLSPASYIPQDPVTFPRFSTFAYLYGRVIPALKLVLAIL